MAVPKRRKSKSKIGMRRSHDAVGIPQLRPCPKCGAYTKPHRVCAECGFYKDKLVVEPKVKLKD